MDVPHPARGDEAAFDNTKAGLTKLISWIGAGERAAPRHDPPAAGHYPAKGKSGFGWRLPGADRRLMAA